MGADSARWTEEAVNLGDSSKLRWSIGGKKDNWEGRTKGVTLIRGSHRCEWKKELEVLEDDEEEEEDTDPADFLMKEAIRFIMEEFQNLKARETLARMSDDDDH
ncbi:hypothetical protein E2320_002147 [Naja naja]|nr:hypothetical protein E2320_002147 [Naja naja]